MNNDPFDELEDEELAKAHIALRSQQIKEQIYNSISRGNHNINWLIDRYQSDLFPPEEIRKFVSEMRVKILAEHGTFDPKMEVLGYLATNAELKNTLFDMLDSAKGREKTKVIVELVKAIAALDAQRMDFIKFAGLGVKMGQQERMNHEIDETGSFEVLLEEATEIERSLTNGETRSSREIVRKVEDQ